LAWSPDGRWLAAGDEGATLTIMGPAESVTETWLPGRATAVVWPDRAEVAVAAGLGAIVVDAGGRMVAHYVMHPGRVNDVAWDPVGGDLLVASAGGIRFYDPAGSGIDPVAIAPSPGTVLSLAVSPGGELVAGGRLDGCVIVWHLDGGTAQELTGSEGGVEHLSWRCDGRQLAVAACGELTVWSLDEGQVLEEGLIHCPVIGGPRGAPRLRTLAPLAGMGRPRGGGCDLGCRPPRAARFRHQPRRGRYCAGLASLRGPHRSRYGAGVGGLSRASVTTGPSGPALAPGRWRAASTGQPAGWLCPRKRPVRLSTRDPWETWLIAA
jgi:hypothetical protein